MLDISVVGYASFAKQESEQAPDRRDQADNKPSTFGSDPYGQ